MLFKNICLHCMFTQSFAQNYNQLSMLVDMYFKNLRKCVTLCRNKLITGVYYKFRGRLLMRGLRGEHLHTHWVTSNMLQSTLFSLLISSPLRLSDAIKLFSTQYTSPHFNFKVRKITAIWDRQFSTHKEMVVGEPVEEWMRKPNTVISNAAVISMHMHTSLFF